MSDTLLLTLHKQAFGVMVTGEKDKEYRRISDWILSRLYTKDFEDRQYKFIKFVNGYGNDKPYFICKYVGWRFVPLYEDINEKYSNGLHVQCKWADTLVILCGEIVERGNMPLQMYSVWLEGYAVTGNDGEATYQGTFTATSFKEACKMAAAKHQISYYDEKRNTYWGCRYFDNEGDARKSFG